MTEKLTMLDYLQTIEQHGLGARDYLTERGVHPNVVYAKALKASRKGYTDSGVVADLCWLTDKGRAFLADGM